MATVLTNFPFAIPTPVVGAPIPRIGPESAGVLMTPEEFDAIEESDEEYSYELVHGVLVVNSLPLEAEVGPNELLGHKLYIYQQTHPQGAALDATLPERYIRLPHSRRRADRVIWCGLGRYPNPRQEIPRIAVEFVSRGKRNWQRDYVLKRTEYAAAGVEEYWVIDRFSRRMTVFRNTGAQAEELAVNEQDTFTTPLLPGFELKLAEILGEADRWAVGDK